jgi:ATP-dependent protease ClpP protease subunit
MRETDTFITPSQALEYGICHEVKSWKQKKFLKRQRQR